MGSSQMASSQMGTSQVGASRMGTSQVGACHLLETVDALLARYICAPHSQCDGKCSGKSTHQMRGIGKQGLSEGEQGLSPKPLHALPRPSAAQCQEHGVSMALGRNGSHLHPMPSLPCPCVHTPCGRMLLAWGG